MSSTQKKINLNNILGSGEQKNSLNEKVKNRNYKQFIKRIKANSTEKLEFSVMKNQNNSNYQHQNNLLANLTNLNNNFAGALNSNNPNLSSHMHNLNFQSTNFSVNSKEKVNERYGSNNFHTQGNSVLDKKITEKRAKSGLATSLTNLEILRKNQESRATNSNLDISKIPNSNESNPSSSSNKIDIKISFNYSKNNSLNNNNKSSVKNLSNSNNMNNLPYQANVNNNITNNHITNNNYANYYLRYKNLSKPNNLHSNNANLTNNCINNNFSNVNTSNNYEYMNTYSQMNTSINNKTAILNTSYMNNTNKPTILQDSNYNKIKADSTSKNKNLINVNNSANFNFQSLNNSNLLKKKINDNNDSEITSDDLKNLNNSVSKGKINNNLNNININKTGGYGKKPQSESHFYQNNLNISVSNNIENKPIINNYYAKSKGNNNSFAFNENMLEKINRGINSISLNKNVNNNKNEFYNNQVQGTENSILMNSINNINNNINTNLNSINNTNSTGLDYNSVLLTNSASSENLITTEKTKDSINQNMVLNTDGNLNSGDSTKLLMKNEEFTLNRKNNDFIEILDNINIRETNNNNSNLESSLNLLEKKLDQKLISIKQENEKNKILNLTKKYSAYKTIFEESIKSINECNNIKTNILLTKILNGYNDTVQTLFMNFSKLHEKYVEGESVYQNYKNLSRKYTDLFKSYESKCEDIKKLQVKNSAVSVDKKEDDTKILITEGLQDSTENLFQSQFVNFNPGNSTNNINQNYINKTNESVIINQTNKKNSHVKSHFSNNNDISVDHGIGNKTFANIHPQMKNSLDFSQIKIDTENSVIFNNNNNEKNNNVSSNVKENRNSLNNPNSNLNNFNVVKLRLSDADLPTEEELINQKNAKIMLKMIGKNNIDDLDSIYFFDKINMRSNSASITKVPKLDFNVMKIKLRRNEESQNQANQIHQQMINNSHINYLNNQNYNMNNIHQMQNLKKNNLKLDDINYTENPKHINFTTSNKNFMKINNLNVSTNNYNQLKNSQIIKESNNPNVYMKKLNASINIENKKK